MAFWPNVAAMMASRTNPSTRESSTITLMSAVAFATPDGASLVWATGFAGWMRTFLGRGGRRVTVRLKTQYLSVYFRTVPGEEALRRSRVSRNEPRVKRVAPFAPFHQR